MVVKSSIKQTVHYTTHTSIYNRYIPVHDIDGIHCFIFIIEGRWKDYEWGIVCPGENQYCVDLYRIGVGGWKRYGN